MSVRFSGEHVGNDTPHDPEELVRRVCEDALGSVRYEPASSGFCRVCTRAISFYAGNRDYGVLHADFGYGSHLDGNRYHLNLCDDCFQSTLDFLAARARLLRGVDSPDQGPFGLVHSDSESRQELINVLEDKLVDRRSDE